MKMCESRYDGRLYVPAGNISKCLNCLATWKKVNRIRKLVPLVCQMRKELEKPNVGQEGK